MSEALRAASIGSGIATYFSVAAPYLKSIGFDPEHGANVVANQLNGQIGRDGSITGGLEHKGRTFESQIVGTRQNSGQGIVT